MNDGPRKPVYMFNPKSREGMKHIGFNGSPICGLTPGELRSVPVAWEGLFRTCKRCKDLIDRNKDPVVCDLSRLPILLRVIRIDRGLKLRDAGKLSGLSVSTIRNVEMGRGSGQVQTLAKLADAYGIRLSDVISLSEGVVNEA